MVLIFHSGKLPGYTAKGYGKTRSGSQNKRMRLRPGTT